MSWQNYDYLLFSLIFDYQIYPSMWILGAGYVNYWDCEIQKGENEEGMGLG